MVPPSAQSTFYLYILSYLFTGIAAPSCGTTEYSINIRLNNYQKFTRYLNFVSYISNDNCIIIGSDKALNLLLLASSRLVIAFSTGIFKQL